MHPSNHSEDVLIYPRPLNHVPPHARQEFLANLANKIRGRAHSAYVFGSFVTEQFDDQSDLDLILVADSNLPFLERFKDFSDLLELPIGLDLFVYTPEEFARQMDRAEEGPGFWRSVRDGMVQIL